MYLTSIDKKTGLVDIEDTNDGVLAIKTFRDLIEQKGLECFTCVALVVDYLTPIRHYAFRERHIKAMRDVTGDGKAFAWGEDIIQTACLKYEELQFNADLRELELLKTERQKKIQAVESTEDDDEKARIFKKLKDIRESQENLKSKMNFKEIVQQAPTINGYTLSRLEAKITNKNSFYHGEKSNAKRPSGASSSSGAADNGKRKKSDKSAVN